ncbi:MAG: M14 family zinc carboxypeptidase [Promethearchaeota archaeon]
MRLKAEFLNKIEINLFPCVGSNEQNILIIGGVHGNEIQGVKGTELVINYLKKPEKMLTQEILKKATIVVVPCINLVGYLADARTCPKKGTEVEYEQGKVKVKWDEKHSIKIPPNWHDPNRGWNNNDTLVKYHLEWLCKTFSPSLIIFNHDWDVPQGKINVYGPVHAFESISNATKIYERFYHTHNAYGEPWSFVDLINQQEVQTMSFLLWEKLGIPIYLTETCVVADNSPKIHLAIDLFLLAKYVRIQWKDDDLLKKILQEITQDNLEV